MIRKSSLKLTLTTIFCSILFSLTATAAPINFTTSNTSPPAIVVCEDFNTPYADVFQWIYKTEDGKIFRRLYNVSTSNWVGDWIYVRDAE